MFNEAGLITEAYLTLQVKSLWTAVDNKFIGIYVSS
jgi:hypothetical protein